MYKSFKINNFSITHAGVGIQKISDFPERQEVMLKSLSANDSLVFEHDFYRTKKIHISDMNLNIGTIELENFGNYSPAENMSPDKTTLHFEHGTFLNVWGKDTSSFLLAFDSFSLPEEELEMVAIPVKDFDFLPPSFNLISGIHLKYKLSLVVIADGQALHTRLSHNLAHLQPRQFFHFHQLACMNYTCQYHHIQHWDLQAQNWNYLKVFHLLKQFFPSEQVVQWNKCLRK
jgi:hypothetical protein